MAAYDTHALYTSNFVVSSNLPVILPILNSHSHNSVNEMVHAAASSTSSMCLTMCVSSFNYCKVHRQAYTADEFNCMSQADLL